MDVGNDTVGSYVSEQFSRYFSENVGAMRNGNEELRGLFVLRASHDLFGRVEEIAQELGVPQDQVRSQIKSCGLQALRGRYEGLYEAK
jgi:DNA-directed RNA polymerase specialized sigma24 family protein